MNPVKIILASLAMVFLAMSAQAGETIPVPVPSCYPDCDTVPIVLPGCPTCTTKPAPSPPDYPRPE